MFYCKVKDRCRTPHAASVFFTLHKIFILSVCDLNAVDHRLFVCFDCSIIIRWVGIFADFINDIHTFCHFTKCCVIAIQESTVLLDDKKL